MLRQADAAMYRAKTTTKGVAVYDAAIDTDRPHRMALFADLRELPVPAEQLLAECGRAGQRVRAGQWTA